MGHHELRHDSECQNCGHTVELEYCSKCGQQNVETRQSFRHLITHIAEDITHYDGNFWKTIKHLLLRPGKLTTEYLMGHRVRYVPPVKLYIFISFICFFIMALMAPDAEEHEEHNTAHQKTKQHITVAEKEDPNTITYEDYNFKTVHELDSIQASLPKAEKMPLLVYYALKASVKGNERNFTFRDFVITAAHTLPKVLFIYMPLFVFWLWLFHGKRRWYFFDHGIYTLHYFSFLLLLITITMISAWLFGFISSDVSDIVIIILMAIGLPYSFFYFFRSHRKMYGETRAISRLKSFAIFIINFFCILITVLVSFVYIILNIH